MKTAFGVACLALTLAAASAQSYGYGMGMGSYGYYGSGPSGPCAVSFNFTSHGDSTYKCGSGICKVVQVAVTNNAPYPIPYGWSLTLTSAAWADPIYAIFTWWNCDHLSLSNGTLSLTSNAQWQRLMPNGGTEGLGYIMEGPSDDNSLFTPTSATLNGRSCMIM